MGIRLCLSGELQSGLNKIMKLKYFHKAQGLGYYHINGFYDEHVKEEEERRSSSCCGVASSGEDPGCYGSQNNSVDTGFRTLTSIWYLTVVT